MLLGMDMPARNHVCTNIAPQFEHGTISYLLSSTVTRPTAIAPTSTKHCKLNVQEIIDIGPIPKPKPQTLSLEVLNKRGKPKRGKKKHDLSRTDTSLDSANGMQSPTSISPQPEDEPPRSPVPSEMSTTSVTGSGTSSEQTGSGTPPLSTMNFATQCSLDPETIASATTELLQGGCMAGDTMPIRISIHHAKPLKNMQGIVITLFRQGRIDTHPAIPLGPCRRGKRLEYEDYYPKSRTGLGGLSLSSAGSSRSFRQDLNQIFAPIIVDPHTHSHVVNTSISVPVDLFPTIWCVPGAMISFTYYIEIVVDLRSKIGSQDRIRPHMSMTSTQQHGYGDSRISRHEGTDGVSYLSTPGFNYLLTDQLRRTRGVIFTRNEIVVGTRDSARKRGKQREGRSVLADNMPFRGCIHLGREQDPQDPEFDCTRRPSATESQDERQQSIYQTSHQPTAYIPPPDVEEDLDEKARLRRAGQRLLPSAPPQHEGPSSSVPTAPPAINEEDFIRRYGLGPPAPAYAGPSITHFAHSNDTIRYNAAAPLIPGPHDDKQELERQRLLALASSPPTDTTGDEAESAEVRQQGLQPSAPVLYEDDIFDVNDPRVPQVLEDFNIVDESPGNQQASNAGSTADSAPSGEASDTDHGCHEAGPSNDELLDKDNLPVYKR